MNNMERKEQVEAGDRDTVDTEAAQRVLKFSFVQLTTGRRRHLVLTHSTDLDASRY